MQFQGSNFLSEHTFEAHWPMLIYTKFDQMENVGIVFTEMLTTPTKDDGRSRIGRAKNMVPCMLITIIWV